MAKTRKIKVVSRVVSIEDLDDLCRLYIMKKHNKCQVCGSTRYLQCGHFITRSNKHTRWDIEANVYCLCAGCHMMRMDSWHKDPATATEWVRKHLGEKEFDKLRMRAHETGKIDRSLIKVYLKQKIKELDA